MVREQEQITVIFNEIYPNLCRFLESLLGRREGLAQDIAQESFLRLCQTDFEQISAVEIRYWLFRVARNLALNEIDRARTRLKLWERAAEIFSFKSRNAQEAIEQNERQRRLRRLLAELPEHQRSALLLREQEEMSYREIAFVLGITESKVKVDIFRARTALREKWNEIAS